MPRKGKNGNIYSTPRKAVFCNRCKEPCGMYPSGKAGIPKLVCSTCKVKAKRLPKKYCNLCGTDWSLEWHTWKRMHLCRPCNIEQQRIYPENRSRQSHLTHEDIDGGLALLQFLKDSGELDG